MYELENDDEIEIDLRELFLALKKKIVWILLTAIVFAGAIRTDHEVCDDTDLFFYSTALCRFKGWTFTAYRSYNGYSVNTRLYGNC